MVGRLSVLWKGIQLISTWHYTQIMRSHYPNETYTQLMPYEHCQKEIYENMLQ
jgi:hypothetical protein